MNWWEYKSLNFFSTQNKHFSENIKKVYLKVEPKNYSDDGKFLKDSNEFVQVFQV